MEIDFLNCFLFIFYLGSIYTIGGWSGAKQLASMERLDPREGKWKYSTHLPVERNLLSAVSIGSDIYAIGRVRYFIQDFFRCDLNYSFRQESHYLRVFQASLSIFKSDCFFFYLVYCILISYLFTYYFFRGMVQQRCLLPQQSWEIWHKK